MSIVGLQRRLREAGRIRIGDRDPNKGFPRKLKTFRFTSPDATIIDEIAKLYGGTPHAWADQWEVLTKAERLEVIVPPAGMAHSVYYELWSGGGCQRRCDGVTELLSDSPCLCDPDPAKRECKPHTRLSVILPDLPTVGVWRIDSTGWYAATELIGIVEMLDALAQAGRYCPAELRLEWREVKRAGEAKRQFAVPVLDPKIPMRELAAWSGSAASGAGTGGNGGPSLPSFTPVPASLPQAPAPSITEQLAPRARTPRKNAVVPIPSTGLEPGAAEPSGADEALPPEASSPSEEGPALGTHMAAGPSDDGPTLAPEAFISIEIAEALGTKDADVRHAFIKEWSEGLYVSAKDVPIDRIADLRAALVIAKRERDAHPMLTVEDVPTPPEGELFPLSDLEQLSARELYDLCEQRGLTPVPARKAERIAALRGQ